MNYLPQSKPYIKSRASWGARTPNTGGSNNPEYVIIHHSGEENDAWSPIYTTDSSFQKRIQDFHIDGRGWGDIGYNYGIGQDASILEGRNPEHEGAHTSGYNTRGVGIVLHGNYNIRNITSSQKNKLVDLTAWLCEKYDIHYNNIIGHRNTRNGNEYDCPGKDINDDFESIRTQVITKLTGLQPS